MNSINSLLNESERKWRGQVKEHFPLYSNTPVIIKECLNGRDWSFSTDLKNIYASIGNDKGLQEKFEKDITKYWLGTPDELAQATLHYLLWHEQYHPIEAPYSVKGEDNDQKMIHQSIRKGLLMAEPGLKPVEQLMKVMASQNGVKDFILDNRFSLDNNERDYVRGDVIPVWDLIELSKAGAETNFYTITRLMYAYMYGPKSIHKYFKKKAGKKGQSVAEQALSTLINKQTRLSEASDCLQLIRNVFAGSDRYEGITRLMSILGPYVTQGMPQGRPMQGEGSGSPMNILQDLLDDMDQSEQESFIQDLSQESIQSLEDMISGLTNTSHADEARNLDVLALHEYYKRNHPRVVILGGKQVGESVIVGKQEYWRLKNSTVLTGNQLSRVNLQRINNLQKRTRLPWLIDLGNDTYRLNEYELKSRDKKDIVYVHASLDVPDVTELYLDSSGSMYGYSAGEFKVNDGSRWDMLCNVLYGYINALRQGGKEVGKQAKIRVHNFADKQVSSGLINVERFWQGNPEALRVLFKPGNGYDKEDIDITDYGNGRKRAYVIVTDGDLVISGRTEREAKKMKTLAAKPYNQVLLFEIGGAYSLGKAVKGEPGINYHQVHDKKRMLEAGLEVLLSK